MSHQHRKTVLAFVVFIVLCAGCGPSDAKGYADKVCENASAAAFSRSAGVTADADKMLKEAKRLDAEFKKKFEGDRKERDAYDKLMATCTKEHNLKGL